MHLVTPSVYNREELGKVKLKNQQNARWKKVELKRYTQAEPRLCNVIKPKWPSRTVLSERFDHFNTKHVDEKLVCLFWKNVFILRQLPDI